MTDDRSDATANAQPDGTAPGQETGPWYKQLHWQIFLGLLVALIYAVIVRQLVPVAPLPDVDMANATVQEGQSVVSAAIEAGQKRAPAQYQLEQFRAPFSFIGDLFIRLLKLIIIPLILTSVISGIVNLRDPEEVGRLGLRTIAYYMMTTLAAVSMGLLVVNVLQPGKGLNLSIGGEAELEPTPLSEVFLNIVPENIFGALSQGAMLPTIFTAILVGLGLLAIGDKGKPVADFVNSANELVLTITNWIMATAPIGVAALFVNTLLDPELLDIVAFFEDLGVYMIAVVGGLALHAMLVLPLMLMFLAKYPPHLFAKALSPALLTAFSTASSSATYPVTLESVTERAGVSEKSADFVLPLGATINMDGTALYEAVAAVFIANALGMDLSFAQQLIIVVTATLAAIGAAGVPSAGLVTMIIVLESVGLPGAGYGLVVAVDRILDMCRTTVNVWGDSVGAAVVGRWIEDNEKAVLTE
jgi:Na+/H+-dicarboxylate symporter